MGGGGEGWGNRSAFTNRSVQAVFSKEGLKEGEAQMP